MGMGKQSYSDGKQKVQKPKFARTHAIMRWCIWLAGSGYDGGAPEHLCGSSAPKKKPKKQKTNQAWPATGKWTTVRQVCWSASDWLSPARNKVRCASGPPAIGWACLQKKRKKNRLVRKTIFNWLPLPGSAGEWVSKRMALWQLVRLGPCEGTIWEWLVNMLPFKDIFSILFI